MTDLRIIETEDGSSSLYDARLKETYHSTHGAIQESNHVFIEKGLQYLLERNNNTKREISIFEVGFGTGLNALLSLEESIKKALKINYLTIEPFPISKELVSRLNFHQYGLSRTLLLELHDTLFEKWSVFNTQFRFKKSLVKLIDLNTESLQKYFDIVYFDAFAPNKQPELWTKESLKMIVPILKPNGILVTYCAKGQLKRDLKEIGFSVESLPGPPGKREMIRATLV